MLVALINERDVQMARVARVLHDDVGQVLSAAGLQLDVMRLDFDPHCTGIAARTAEIQQMLEQAIIQLRELSYELNPNIVERAGLQVALERLIGRYRAQFQGVLRLHFDPAVHLDGERGATLYKIADFALDNAVRHSESSQIDVLLRRVHGQAVLEVRDNGIGFEKGGGRSHSHGLGLLLMRTYADRGGFDLQVKTAPGRGTIIRVRPAQEAADASV